MPYDPQPFDYEPVTRQRGPSLPEDEERFTVSKRRGLSVTTEEEWAALRQTSQTPSAEITTPPSVVNNTSVAMQPTPASKHTLWILRRGHLFSFIGLFLFTSLLYFRPYELFPSLAATKGIAYWVAAATLLVFLPSQFVVEGNLTARPREVNLVLLLALLVLLSVPLAIDRTEAWQAAKEFLKVIVMFIVMVNVMRTEWRWMIILLLSLGVGCLVSAGAIHAYQLGLFKDNGQRIVGLIGGMFGNSNDLALHLVIMTPIAVALFFSTRNIFFKVFYAAAAALMLAGNVVTLSRGGLLGMIGALGVLLWKLGRRHRLLVFALALSIGFSLVLFMPGMMVERIASIFDPTSDASAAGSASGRQELLFRSVVVMVRHPLLGVGMSNFRHLTFSNQVSHNAYTQIGAEVGIPAMVIYILFMVAALKRMQGIERETLAEVHHSRFYYLSVGLQASLIGYMISSFFLSVAHLYYIYYLVGYAVCWHRIYEANQMKVVRPIVHAESHAERETGGERRRPLPLRDTEAATSQ